MQHFTLDDELVDAVDKIVKKLKMTRSAFTHQALRNALVQANIKQLETKHKKGYEKVPVKDSEELYYGIKSHGTPRINAEHRAAYSPLVQFLWL